MHAFNRTFQKIRLELVFLNTTVQQSKDRLELVFFLSREDQRNSKLQHISDSRGHHY